MNVFISADIEGICGVAVGAHQGPEDGPYQRACEWMVAEVNAAVEGAVAAGARRIVVRDAHNHATNIDIERLHPAAELITGWGPLRSMVEGVEDGFDALCLIGYHARAVTVDGTLAHTWSSHVLDLRLNGTSVGEAAWAAGYAGHYGVPLAIASGDEQFVTQIGEELPAGFATVTTKSGLTRFAARMRPVDRVRDEIRDTTRRALADSGSLPVFRPDLPLRVSIRFRNWERLTICGFIPGVERQAADTFAYEAADFVEAQKMFAVLHELARS